MHNRYLSTEEREQRKTKRMYAALKRVRGIGNPDITDASLTINETLYGENEAWKGQCDQRL
jgi:hypothetical protein